jgi:RNA polymerase primary sigma factor
MTANMPYPLAAWLRLPLLTADQERDLAARIHAGETSARDELVAHNARLAVYLAKPWRAGIEYEDRCSVAVEALLTAARYFDPSRGRFSTLASKIIKQSLYEASITSRPIKLPRDSARATADLAVAEREFYRENHEPATDAELANVLDWTLAEVERVRNLPEVVASLDKAIEIGPDGSVITLGDARPSHLPGPEASALANEARDIARAAIAAALAALPADQARVLALRHGLDGQGYRTCPEIADEMDLTATAVYVLLRKAKAAMRRDRRARDAWTLAA